MEATSSGPDSTTDFHYNLGQVCAFFPYKMKCVDVDTSGNNKSQ